MNRVAKWLCALIVACTVFMVAKTAEATHFRYGNIVWRVPDPVNFPLTVEFTVTHAYRDTGFSNDVQLNFGDGNSGNNQQGAQIGAGVDLLGATYFIYQYTETHTYLTPGNRTAFFELCCRLDSIINTGAVLLPGVSIAPMS